MTTTPQHGTGPSNERPHHDDVHALLPQSVFLLVAHALSALWAPVAHADLDVDPVAVNLTGSIHIAANVIVGDPIEVCTDEYPNASADAVAMWNTSLHDGLDDGHGNRLTPPLVNADQDVFRYAATDCTDIGNSDLIRSVHIDSRRESDNDFFCRSGVNACYLCPPRTSSPHHSYSGALQVIMNEANRPAADDSLRGTGDESDSVTDPFWRYRRLERTMRTSWVTSWAWVTSEADRPFRS